VRRANARSRAARRELNVVGERVERADRQEFNSLPARAARVERRRGRANRSEGLNQTSRAQRAERASTSGRGSTPSRPAAVSRAERAASEDPGGVERCREASGTSGPTGVQLPPGPYVSAERQRGSNALVGGIELDGGEPSAAR